MHRDPTDMIPSRATHGSPEVEPHLCVACHCVGNFRDFCSHIDVPQDLADADCRVPRLYLHRLQLEGRLGHNVGRLVLTWQQFERGTVDPIFWFEHGARLRSDSGVLPGGDSRFQLCDVRAAGVDAAKRR